MRARPQSVACLRAICRLTPPNGRDCSYTLCRVTESSSGALRAVLIVTGSERTRRMYAEYLGWRGVAVREVDGAAAAIRELASFRPDVVVTEDRLPDSTGQELVRALRRSRFTFDLPLVLLSSDTFDGAATA